MDLAEYLVSKDVQLKQGNDQNYYTTCFFCNEDPGKRGRLYFNLNPESSAYGLYFCFLCQARGGINSIRKHFGDPPIKEDEFAEQFSYVFETATQYYMERLYEHPEAYEYLRKERGLEEATIEKLRLGWADGGPC